MCFPLMVLKITNLYSCAQFIQLTFVHEGGSHLAT